MKRWTKEDVLFLKENINKLSKEELCLKLGRAWYLIEYKLYNLKIKFFKKHTRQQTNEKQQEWRKNNLKKRLLTSAKERAKQKNIPFDLTENDINIPEKCPILGIDLFKNQNFAKDNSPALDRVIPELGYVKGNVLVISFLANRIKNSADYKQIKDVSIAVENFLFEKFKREKKEKKINILVIGESCLDIWNEGQIRLNPEAPTIALKIKNKRENIGMAGNVFENLKSISNKNNVYLLSNKNLIKKERYVDINSKNILLRLDSGDEDTEELTIEKFNDFLTETKLSISNIDAIIFSDYDKGFLSTNLISKISEICLTNNIITFLDTKKILGEWSKNIDFVKINKKEYENQLKANINFNNVCKNIIITLGELGCLDLKQNKKIETIKIETRDVSGCGDVFLAAFSYKYLNCKNIIDSMRFANICASYAASKIGVVKIDMEQIDNYFFNNANV